MRMLSAILDIVFPPRDTEALARSATAEMLRPFVRPRRIADDIVALLPYRAPLPRALIVEAKFKDGKKAQELLGGLLADYLEGDGPVLVPVPLSDARRKERGYNQAERICRASGGVVDAEVLIRARDTLPQTSLGGRKRRNNVAGAFLARAPDPLRTYILVDDVTTTGATLAEALAAMRAAGAMRVSAVALAH